MRMSIFPSSLDRLCDHAPDLRGSVLHIHGHGQSAVLPCPGDRLGRRLRFLDIAAHDHDVGARYARQPRRHRRAEPLEPPVISAVRPVEIEGPKARVEARFFRCSCRCCNRSSTDWPRPLCSAQHASMLSRLLLFLFAISSHGLRRAPSHPGDRSLARHAAW